MSNQSTYIQAMKGGKSVRNLNLEDDNLLMNRLKRISYFDGGDADINRKGNVLISLYKLHDYRRDINKDSELGKYNPVSSKVWDFHSEVSAKKHCSICRV